MPATRQLGHETPRVSVILAVYNGDQWVAGAIDSALAQEFTGAEVVVVNDGSTDSTARILQSYGPKIQIINQRNRGLGAARNAAVACAQGEYVAFLDADDVWHPAKLQKSVAALDSHPEAALVFTDCTAVSEEGIESRLTCVGYVPSIDDLLRCACMIPPSTVVMRRRVLELCGGFAEEFRFGYEDVFAWLLAREQGSFLYIPEPLTRYRLKRFSVRALEYERGRVAFERLVFERYGRRGRSLVLDNRRLVASGLLQAGLEKFDAGARRDGLNLLLRVFGINPFFLLGQFRRLFRRQNLKRIRGAISSGAEG